MAKTKNLIGSWAFLIGVLMAVIFGFVGNLSGNWLIGLVIIGLVVGILNVTGNENMPFLMSGVSLIITSAFGGGVLRDVAILQNILNSLLVIFIPATIVVAV